MSLFVEQFLAICWHICT